MSAQTTLLAATAAAAFLGATIFAMQPSKAEVYGGDRSGVRIDRRYDQRPDGRDRLWHDRVWPRPFSRVEAFGRVPSFEGPRYIAEWRAKRQAILHWREKVSARYGEEFARWWMARDKDVDCGARADFVFCKVSAVPSRGGLWGWSGY